MTHSTTIRTDNSACPTCCNCRHANITNLHGMRRWVCIEYPQHPHEIPPYHTCPHFTPREK